MSKMPEDIEEALAVRDTKVAGIVRAESASDIAGLRREVEVLKRSLDGRTRSLQEVVEAKDRLVKMYEAKPVESGQAIHIVFDGPPGAEPGRFVEVEDADGHGVNVGEWKEREDGYWVLVLNVVAGEGR